MSAGPGGVTEMARGFGYSIYLMLTLVFGIMGSIVFIVARTIIREEKAREARERAPAAPVTSTQARP